MNILLGGQNHPLTVASSATAPSAASTVRTTSCCGGSPDRARVGRWDASGAAAQNTQVATDAHSCVQYVQVVRLNGEPPAHTHGTSDGSRWRSVNRAHSCTARSISRRWKTFKTPQAACQGALKRACSHAALLLSTYVSATVCERARTSIKSPLGPRRLVFDTHPTPLPSLAPPPAASPAGSPPASPPTRPCPGPKGRGQGRSRKTGLFSVGDPCNVWLARMDAPPWPRVAVSCAGPVRADCGRCGAAKVGPRWYGDFTR